MATTATATHNSTAPSSQEAIAALEEARAGTLALIAGLSERGLGARAFADHEPARVGSRSYRRL